EDDRPLAQGNDRDIGVVADRFGNDVDRVGVIDEYRPRAHSFHVGYYAAHSVDRAQRHEEAARPLRLLADHAVLERHALVDVARFEATGAEAGEHSVAIGEPRP